MKKFLAFLSLAVVVAALSAQRSQGDQPANVTKVGTYDTRAIAIAFAPSKYNPVAEKMKEHRAAKEAGDEAKVKELEAWGEKHQRALHRQGFGRVPVDDLLEPVRGQLADVADAAGVSVITASCNYVGAGVEVVDVTDALVALFEPSEKTLAFVQQIREVDPVDLDEIERNQDH